MGSCPPISIILWSPFRFYRCNHVCRRWRHSILAGSRHFRKTLDVRVRRVRRDLYNSCTVVSRSDMRVWVRRDLYSNCTVASRSDMRVRGQKGCLQLLYCCFEISSARNFCNIPDYIDGMVMYKHIAIVCQPHPTKINWNIAKSSGWRNASWMSSFADSADSKWSRYSFVISPICLFSGSPVEVIFILWRFEAQPCVLNVTWLVLPINILSILS